MKIISSLILILDLTSKLTIALDRQCWDYYATNSECSLTSINDNRVTWCYGAYSCSKSSLNVPQLGCSGYRACANAERINVSGVVYCDGILGCWGVPLIKALKICCHGYGACLLVEILESSEDIECTGYAACFKSDTIKSTSGSIYCSGIGACKEVSRIEASSDIYCDGNSGCEISGDIKSINGGIYC